MKWSKKLLKWSKQILNRNKQNAEGKVTLRALIYKIPECYTENCTTTKFRHAHLMTLIFVGMSI